MAGKTSLVLLDAHLSVGRDHHVYVLFLLPTEISDLASWQVFAHHVNW